MSGHCTPCEPHILVSVVCLIPGAELFLGLGVHNFRGLYAKRTNMLAYFSPIIKGSRVLTVIWGRAGARGPIRRALRLALLHQLHGGESGMPPTLHIKQ